MSFKELYHIDVNKNTEKVDNLTYLSWAWAWAEVKKVDPMATYEIIEFPMLADGPNGLYAVPGFTVPFLKTPEGYFVKVAVTINGLTLTETLPVMNNKNVPLGTVAPMWVRPSGGGKATQEYKETPMPTTFDINKSHKRCLAKAIALHGLGLYIYAGEDVPEKDPEVEAKAAEEQKRTAKSIRELQRETRLNRTPEIANALDAYVNELQVKAKAKVEQMPLELTQRMLALVTQKLDELLLVPNKEEVKA